MVQGRDGSPNATDTTQAAVDALIGELRKSVEKLKDSNRQLQEALDNGDQDPEFRAAIGVGLVSPPPVQNLQWHNEVCPESEI